MMLSEVLNSYYVMPLNQSVLVGFTINDDIDENDVNPITITWHDEDTGEDYLQVFDDQKVQMFEAFAGAFLVEDSNGESLAFLALEGVQPSELFS